MAIIYSLHAREMLKHRQIKQALVKKCISDPDYILPTKESRKIYLKDFGINFLKLVLVEEGDDKIIITVFWIAKRRIRQ